MRWWVHSSVVANPRGLRSGACFQSLDPVCSSRSGATVHHQLANSGTAHLARTRLDGDLGVDFGPSQTPFHLTVSFTKMDDAGKE